MKNIHWYGTMLSRGTLDSKIFFSREHPFLWLFCCKFFGLSQCDGCSVLSRSSEFRMNVVFSGISRARFQQLCIISLGYCRRKLPWRRRDVTKFYSEWWVLQLLSSLTSCWAGASAVSQGLACSHHAWDRPGFCLLSVSCCTAFQRLQKLILPSLGPH